MSSDSASNFARVLLTGVSGVGKSSVIEELRRRGFRAIDMDEPGWSSHDESGHQRWNEGRLRAELAAMGNEALFVSGCAESQVTFYPQFTHVVLLSAPAGVIRQRLARRPNNPYGKRPEELAEVMKSLTEIEPLLRRRATIEIDTRLPLDEVAQRVIDLLKSG